MTLAQLSLSYQREAEVLHSRIQLVRQLPVHTREEALLKRDRLRLLEAMRRDVRDVAALCGRYYEPGFRRNPRYTL